VGLLNDQFVEKRAGARVKISGSAAMASASGERDRVQRDVVDQSISSIDDIDHELLHLFIVQPRDLRPGNGAPYGLFTKTSEQSPAAESGEMPACRSSSPEFRKHSSTISFASRCCRTGSVRLGLMIPCFLTHESHSRPRSIYAARL
jgi:hypothetical protein